MKINTKKRNVFFTTVKRKSETTKEKYYKKKKKKLTLEKKKKLFSIFLFFSADFKQKLFKQRKFNLTKPDAKINKMLMNLTIKSRWMQLKGDCFTLFTLY